MGRVLGPGLLCVAGFADGCSAVELGYDEAMKPAKLLAVAAQQGDLPEMREMLAAHPGLAKDWQPIMDACFIGQVEAVELLLDAGADPNVVSKAASKYRPLHRTIEPKITTPRDERHVRIVGILLDRGADPMLRGAYNSVSAVAMAALAGEQRFLDLLLPRTAELDVYHVAALGDVERVKIFVATDSSLATSRDENGMNALDYASRSKCIGAREVVRLLVEAGADPSNALDGVVYRNDVELTALFLSKGATIQDGDTLNHAACEGAHATLDLLVKAGVDLNKTEGTEHHGGYTPFGCTLTMRNIRGATWFLDHWVDPNFVGGSSGESSLHVAVRSGGGPPLLKLLLDRGADAKALDGAGKTPLVAAREKGNHKAVKFLEGNS